MSTHINDLPSAGAIAAGVHPTAVGANASGPTIDFGAIDGDGPCFAIQQVGDLEESGTLDGRIEQSSDGSSWSALSGATFTQVTAANNLQVIRFTRTTRYIRWAATVAGSGVLFTVSAVIGSQKKTF